MKFETQIHMLFVANATSQDWAATDSPLQTVHIALDDPNKPGRKIAYYNEARHLKEWCERHGFQYKEEILEYTFKVKFWEFS